MSVKKGLIHEPYIFTLLLVFKDAKFYFKCSTVNPKVGVNKGIDIGSQCEVAIDVKIR